jgi:integrase
LATVAAAGKTTRPLDPEQKIFTRDEVAKLLRIKPASVSGVVKRAGLPAEGNGRARLFPRSTVVALQERKSRGAGEQTQAYYVREMKSFARWLMTDRRTVCKFLIGLEMPRVHEKRRDRRPLTVDEFRRLIEAARHSDAPYRGLDGLARAQLYEMAAATGFRASELASLTPNDFDFA